MSRNTVLALIALIGVVVVGAGGGYWAYKKIQKKKNQEVRLEMKIQVHGDVFNLPRFKEIILSDKILDPVVDSQNLVSFWKLPDAMAAKERIRTKFKAKLNGGELSLTYQGKDKQKTEQILKGILMEYQKNVKPTGSRPSTTP